MSATRLLCLGQMGKHGYSHAIRIEKRKTANAHWLVLQWLDDHTALAQGAGMKIGDAVRKADIHGKCGR